MRAAALAVLAGLPNVSPTRLRLILHRHDPVDAVDRLVRGRALDPMAMRGVTAPMRDAWAAAVDDGALDRAAASLDRFGVQVVGADDPAYPGELAVDPEPPAVLFVRGDLAALRARRVGIVGTRSATASGRATAAELGRVLAAEGVAVVSGLARGIDGAAHRGVQDAGGPGRPVGVVGNGLDRPYPKRHDALWTFVADAGALLSEWPPGVEPHGWRFPQRNRIIAALSEVLVVVESRERGGSLLTAVAAAERGVEVMAVPGSPRSPAATGTNQLLVDGAAPVTSAADVLTALGLDHRRQTAFDPRPTPDELQQRVLAVCQAQAATLDTIVAETGASVLEAAMAAARLERSGWLIEAGGWFEPAGSRLEPT